MLFFPVGVSGGVDVMINCLRQNKHNSSIVTNLLLSLRNMSDKMVDKETTQFNLLLELLVPLLHRAARDRAGNDLPHQQAVCAAGILSNLTSGNNYNKLKVGILSCFRREHFSLIAWLIACLIAWLIDGY